MINQPLKAKNFNQKSERFLQVDWMVQCGEKTKNGSARAFPFSVDAVVAVNRQCLGCYYARRLRSFMEPAPSPPMRRAASAPGSGAPVGVVEAGVAEISIFIQPPLPVW